MPLRDLKAVVTGGPTREWLDPVRFISNPSTGKMGVEIAAACAGRARETVFIHGPIDPGLVAGRPFRCVSADTTADMLEAVLREIDNNTVLIMAAAPADYSPVKKADQKIKKDRAKITLELKKTPDILKEVAAMKKRAGRMNVFTVGFAAETNNIEEYALKKLKEKDLDMICLNDVSRLGAGFGSDTNIITIFFKSGTRVELPMMTKGEVAARILEEIGSRLPGYLTQG
jgi:phosphopantothenoylcysteine decarboxylase/phosphopantothenate--cysteine ligase